MSNISDIQTALKRYANQFDELKVEERTPIIDLNAIHELTELREDWQNTTTTQTEHKLTTAASTDDTAFLETDERGQYTAGYQVECGNGVRIPTLPTQNSEMRWGYYTVDANGDPFNGFYFGVDAEDFFVAKAREGQIEKVYQENFNRDALKSGEGVLNPSEETLDLTKGNIFQIEFTYYGYGPIEMVLLMDQTEEGEPYTSAEMVTCHVFSTEGETSIGNTNLPLRQEIVSNGTASDALELYVGGRQFSIIGKRTTNSRRGSHYRDSLQNIDNTAWYPAISVRIKDGTDVGSVDFSHVLAEMEGIELSNDTAPKKWEVRRGTVLNSPSWETPSSADGDDGETAMKVDTSATALSDRGEYIDGGILPSGDNQIRNIQKDGVDGRMTPEDTITLMFQAQPNESGAVSPVFLKWTEMW